MWFEFCSIYTHTHTCVYNEYLVCGYMDAKQIVEPAAIWQNWSFTIGTIHFIIKINSHDEYLHKNIQCLI